MVPIPGPGPIALGVVTALALGVIPAATAVSAHPAGPVPPAGAAQRSSGNSSTHTVTLITGDKVTIGTAADGTVVRSFKGANGAATGFHRAVVDGSTYVYPDAVLPYVSAGKLDKQLFNVTRLINDGYDDAHTSRLPLVVRYTDAAARSRTQPKVAGSTVVRRLGSIQGAALAQNREQAPAFWSALTGDADAAARSAKPAFAGGIAKVWLDGKVRANLADSTAQIGAQHVWAEGNTGKGVKVAVLDTGVDPEHPDLVGQVDDSASFIPYEPEITDYHGHGTHVASTVAGTGSASDGKERGVAPGARLAIGKVLDNEGRGESSWIIAGMEWAARDQKARIISMSLGGSGDGTDPMSEAVNQLSRETGALFVIAAGNGGPRSINSPGAADAALTVGAVDSADRLAEFSSQGPRDGDAGLKPEITAPGVDILAARSHYRRGGSGYYTTMSGTSMATPHVAGTAALLAATHPDWTGPRLKEALVSSAKATPAYAPYQAGGGRLDAVAAVRTSVFATASAYSGFQAWPPKPGETDVQKVTYTNVGDAPVSLDLAIDAAAPAGLFALSEDRVTVPAHGTTSVALTAELDRLPVDQPISSMIIGTDSTGTVRARTLIGAAREGQRQNLTINAKDRSGRPLSGRVLLTADHLFTVMELDESGTGTARLPVGSYSGWLTADVRGANGPHSLGMALLSFTDVQLDQDRTVTLDGRKARQVLAHVPRQTTAVAPRLDVHRSFTDSLVESSMLPDASYDSIWALPTGKKVTIGEFEFGARFRLEQPALTVGTQSGTYDDPLVKRAAKPLPAGTRMLRGVFAGEGSAGALAGHDVRGKAVVVRRSDTVAIKEQAQAAAAAGARVLLVVNDGIGRLQPWDETPWSPLDPAPLTVATLNADQGGDLIDALQQGRAVLKVTSQPTTDYVYDVVHHWSGAVPADPAWRVEPRDLGRVDVSFRNHRPGKANEFRYDVWRGWTAGNQLTAPAQGERTDWVTSDAAWLEDAIVPRETGQHSVGVLRYPAGKSAEVSWFGPVQRPRMGPIGFQPVRYLDTMYIPAPGWGDSGAGHVGEARGNYDVKNWMSLYQGDRQLDWGNSEFLPVPGLAAERLPYRLVVDNDRGAWANPYSTHTLTEWNFTSAATGSASAESLPLIQLDYGVDTDRAGRAGRRAELTVTASHLPGTTSTIGKLSVEISYDDGATWQRSEPARHGDRWRTTLKAPSSADFVSLRVTARDSADNSVSQTITRAFGLR
ncbi:S8 family serine peptidase [Streptomyces sp. PSKA30]|uniref:S8 family serine peptidase n=1 Tax=Streptomyces sp. PSKA30 TaxID=2874597 RepID=UPI001CD0832B|nr:S8 family serine peptidase [Streptomyces sp. PSKA30]MBZ9644143.1 S8 family serine peptidase [Streptomyces sp. PSKA30]